MSKLEEHIVTILKQEKIKFEREKTFKDLHYGLYRYDFYIPSLNFLIEVDGEQHYNFNKKFFKNRMDFLKMKERDRIKNSYALARGIRLYRIPFNKVMDIQYFSDIINKNYLVTSKWHNDLIKVK